MNTDGIEEYTCPRCKKPFTRLKRSIFKLVLGMVIIFFSIPGILIGIILVLSSDGSKTACWIFLIAPILFALFGLNCLLGKFCPNCGSKVSGRYIAAHRGREITDTLSSGDNKEKWWAKEKELFKDKKVIIMALLILAYVILIAWRAGAVDAFVVSLFYIIGAYLIVKKKRLFEKEIITAILSDKKVIIALFLAIGILGAAGVIIPLIGSLFYIIGVFIFVYHDFPIIMLPRTGASTHGVVDELVEVEHYGDAHSMYNVYYSFEIPSGEVYLFSMDAKFEDDLNELKNKKLSYDLKDKFKEFPLSRYNPMVTKEKENEWVITDKMHVNFIVRKEGGKLNIYGKVIPANTNLSKSSFASLMQGQPVSVLYDQNHPEINRLADYQQSWLSKYFTMIFSLMFCGIGVLILYFCV